MAWNLDGHEALTYVVALVAAALAVLVFRAHRQRAQNRWFIALLALEFVLASAGASTAVTTDFEVAYWAQFAFMVGLSFAVPVYLGFLSTLGGPVGRFLRTSLVRIIPWSFPVVGLTALLFRRPLMLATPDPTAKDVLATVGGPLLPLFQVCALVMWILGLVAMIAYWRSSPSGTSMRRQSRIFAVAFGIHDAGMLLAVGILLTGGSSSGLGWAIAYYGLPIVKLVLLTFVTYGILRAQLFDIDLKVKWTVGRGTALTLLTGAFFVITETVEFFLPGEGLVANLAGAGIVALLARPAWRLGAKFANIVLPGIVETEEFRHRRRIDVYRSSLEAVAADGVITERERRILDTMRAKLGLSADLVARIERDLEQGAVAARSGAGATAQTLG
jgi:hypothetical protein